MRTFRPGMAGLAPLWAPEAWLGAAVCRGAIRMRDRHLTASYELDDSAGGGWHHLRMPFGTERLDDAAVRSFRSPLDPELTVPPPVHRPAGIQLGPLLQHRLGSRLVWRGTIEKAPGYHRPVSARLSRRAPTAAVTLGMADGRIRLPEALAIPGGGVNRPGGFWTIAGWASGVSLHETLCASGAHSRSLVPARLETIGRAVAAFHSTARLEARGAADVSARDAAGELASIAALRQAAGALFMTEALGRFDAAAARLATDAAQLPMRGAHRPVLLHGDLHDKQILIDGDVVSLIDLDGAAPGMAELDLGNLEAHLILCALQAGRAAETVGPQILALVSGYARSGHHPHAPTRAWYRRASLLRLTLLYLFRLTPEELPELILDAAERFADHDATEEA